MTARTIHRPHLTKRRRARVPLDVRIAWYEIEKSTWDALHLEADYRSRDLAMRQIARRLGV